MMKVAGLFALLLVAQGCLLRETSRLSQQAESAHTPAEHRAVAAAYRERARRLRAEATEHAELAEWWATRPPPQHIPVPASRYEQAEHCRQLSKQLAAAGDEADALANGHEELARPPGAP
jgi:hypothetical protein